MGITVKNATWGDENATTDITDSIIEKAKGGYLDLTANNSLVPTIDMLSGSKTMTLSDSDKSQIAQDAIANCGGNGSDQKCIAFQKNQLEASLLQKKVAESKSSANIITGRRLTLTIIDENGAEKVIAVPDGQSFKAGNKPVIEMPTSAAGGLWTVVFQLLGIGGTIALTLLYVLSIAAPWRIFVLQGRYMVAFGLVVTAILVPWSGLITTPIALAILQSRGSAKVVPFKE